MQNLPEIVLKGSQQILHQEGEICCLEMKIEK